MLTVDEALRCVLEHVSPLGPRELPLAKALGHVLAERIVSDIDSPPHDKSVVDGYAVVAESVTQSGTVLEVVEQVTAGQVPTRSLEAGQATRIMTGAPLPSGADAVVMVEQTSLVENDPRQVRLSQFPVRSGQNIMRRATSLARGAAVLEPGKLLRAIELGLLAEVGRKQVQVIRRPTVAIIATGNELVDLGETPGPGQIRNSNGPLLEALATQAWAEAKQLLPARDEAEQLAERIAEGLRHDVLILSGGVSEGTLDLVPQALARQGVEQIFHKINLKPGKPLWFGRKPRSGPEGSTLVFGLPGNPVSTLVGFELFVRPALARLGGHEAKGLQKWSAKLDRDFQQRGERPTYWPAKLSQAGSAQVVMPLPWKGSGDLRTLTEADCLAFFPGENRTFGAGEQISVLVLPP